MTPPRHAEALMRAFLIEDGDFRDGILGDMSEGWSERAAARGAGFAGRWYWGQAIRSVPSLLALWCQAVGPHRVIAVVVLAIVARLLMLLVQYAAIAIAAVVMSNQPNLVESLVVAIGCVSAAALCGYVVRLARGRDSGVTVARCASRP